jgi:uncharacterized lipoprotein YajG
LQRILFPYLAILVLAACQADWPALVDTEPASRREPAPIVTASEEQHEIPEQDARSDWLTGKVVHIVDGDTLDLLIDEEDRLRKLPALRTVGQA